MMSSRRSFLLGTAAACAYAAARPRVAQAGESVQEVTTPMDAPEWALLERQVIQAHTAACEAFFDRYFDEKGFLLCVTRWGGDDGRDDAIENVNDWPHVHALGGSDRLREMYRKAYEGHVRQYTLAKTTDVPFARDGMYYKEFPVMMDWQHNAEGLTVFNLMGLSDPYDAKYRERVKRFAGFYMNEDPGAPNYDAERRLIKSMFNGSRGPLMRKATPLDWAGDPIDTSRFAGSSLQHGENGYQQMLAHFAEYTDIVGDSPLNLNATDLAMNAYMFDHEAKYKKWLLDYVDAWVERAGKNNGILPSNIGLDGTIGGATGGKWYGGVYGWGFSPMVPMTGKRADRNRVPRSFVGFMNAYLISGGDDRYLDVWRKQADRINEQRKLINGVASTPRMFGDQGWYSYEPGDYNLNFLEIYSLSMKPEDRARAQETPWYSFLEGRNLGYPVKALHSSLAHIRKCGESIRADRTTPETRLADTVMDFNPASVTALTQLMEGGLYIQHPAWARSSPAQGGALLYCRLRYFDPERKRAGIPEDVAALIDTMTDDTVTVTLVNVNSSDPRLVTVQAGACGEHRVLSVSQGDRMQLVNGRSFSVRLAPGAGAKLTIKMKRFANQPHARLSLGMTASFFPRPIWAMDYASPRGRSIVHQLLRLASSSAPWGRRDPRGSQWRASTCHAEGRRRSFEN